MSKRKIATALGAAVLLVGAPLAYADPGGERPEKKTKQCSDGVDNDGDQLIDEGDAGCGSPNDNSEGDEPASEEPGEPGLPAELQAVVDEVLAALEPEEEEPCEPDCPPAEPAPDPLAEVQAAVQEVLDQLPADPPAPPALPDVPSPGVPTVPTLPEPPAPGLPTVPTLPAPPAPPAPELPGLPEIPPPPGA